MSTTTAHSNVLATTIHRALLGAIGGIAGGVAFGLLMQTMGMIEMVAQLVGSDAVVVGWLLHLAISAFIGASFAVLLGSFAKEVLPAALVGMGYGVGWWVLGALIAMPAQLGMPVFTLNTTAWQSLAGHLMFGLILGIAYSQLARREHS